MEKEKEKTKSEKIEETRAEEKSLLDSWKKNKDWKDTIETPAYFEMINYIQMVAKGVSNCAIINGAGGLGKSYTTITILNEQNPDYAYIDSYSTAPAFYIWLYDNRNKILVLDDVVGILEDKRSQAYLKGATWAVNGKRMVHNLSAKPLENQQGITIPDHFEFTGSIILLTNKINKKNPHVNAILTRANYTEVIIGFEEKMDILQKISEKSYNDLSKSDRYEIFNFIKEHASEAVPDLNLRTLIHLYQFFEYSKKIGNPELWKRLGLKLLKKDDLLLLVLELEKEQGLPTIDKKVQRFKELCGKGRATYFRLKSRINLKSQVSEDTPKTYETNTTLV